MHTVVLALTNVPHCRNTMFALCAARPGSTMLQTVLRAIYTEAAMLCAAQPFDWIDKTFIHVPPPEVKEDA